MAGHPSVKKRQKEAARKERQAEKLARRDERRSRRNDPNGGGEGAAPEETADGEWPLERPNDAPVEPKPPDEPGPVAEGKA